MEQESNTVIIDQEKDRRQTFGARVTGAIAGAIGAIVTGHFLLERSLKQWLRNRLHMKDLVNPKAAGTDAIVKSVMNREWKNDYYAALNKPDVAVKAAFDDLMQHKEGVFNTALERFKEECEKHAEIFTTLKKEATGKYTGSRLDEEMQSIEQNLIYLINQAKEKYLDKPVFKEMRKPGTAKSHLGLGLRQADNKEAIIVFSLVTGVTLGAMIYKGVQWFLRRSEEKRQKTHQQQVASSRETPPDGTPLHA